eukprot:scaffold656_cov390-Prasinococcus_capsulatus_cf.AAC.6
MVAWLLLITRSQADDHRRKLLQLVTDRAFNDGLNLRVRSFLPRAEHVLGTDLESPNGLGLSSAAADTEPSAAMRDRSRSRRESATHERSAPAPAGEGPKRPPPVLHHARSPRPLPQSHCSGRHRRAGPRQLRLGEPHGGLRSHGGVALSPLLLMVMVVAVVLAMKLANCQVVQGGHSRRTSALPLATLLPRRALDRRCVLLPADVVGVLPLTPTPALSYCCASSCAAARLPRRRPAPAPSAAVCAGAATATVNAGGGPTRREGRLDGRRPPTE